MPRPKNPINKEVQTAQMIAQDLDYVQIAIRLNTTKKHVAKLASNIRKKNNCVSDYALKLKVLAGEL